MIFEEFKEKYKDLVFCPLPYEVPEIDLDKLYKWIDDNQDCEYNVHRDFGGTMTKDEFDEMHRGPLAFFNSFFLLAGKPGEESIWYRGFDKLFPEFVDFVKSIPILGKPQFGFLKQKNYDDMEDFNPHRLSDLHVDELGGYGIRMYINSNKNNLLFYGLKSKDMAEYDKQQSSYSSTARYNKLDSNGDPVIENGVLMANDNFYDKPVRTKLKTSSQVFLISGINSAHYIEHEQTDKKLTFLIMGRKELKDRYDWGKISQAIEEMKLTRADEFIYHDDLCN